jgi:hypothetical protein
VDAEPSDQAEPINWPWIAGSMIIGLGLNGAALSVEAEWKWTGVVPSILVNVGTAVLLVGVFFLLERRFTRRIVNTSTGAIKQAAQQIGEQLQSRTDALSTRIDDLQRQVDIRMQRRAARGDAKVEALADDVSYATVTAALTEANELGAIPAGQIIVQASHDIDGARIIFRWAADAGPASSTFTIRPPRLLLEPRFEADYDAFGARPFLGDQWRPEEPVEEVAERIVRDLQRKGRWAGAATVDWTVTMENLQRSLALAIASRRGGSSADPWRLHGALYELIGDNWAITTAGVESRHDNMVILGEAEFPDTRDRRNPFAPEPEWRPPAPAGISALGWDRLLRHGRRVHPQYHGPMIHAPGWYPWTTDLAARLAQSEHGRGVTSSGVAKPDPR